MIGNRIKELRDTLGLTGTEFGKPIGLTHGAISHIERGKSTPPPKTIAFICSVYHVNRLWLETGEGEMFAGPPPPEAMVSKEEQRLISRLLYVIRNKWSGEYDQSSKQNINSFWKAAKREAGEPIEEDHEKDFKKQGSNG